MVWKFGAKHVYVSGHKPIMVPYKGWPAIISQVKCLQEVEAISYIEYLLLADGIKLDSNIILCTGYMHHFSFLGDNSHQQCLSLKPRMLVKLYLGRGMQKRLWDLSVKYALAKSFYLTCSAMHKLRESTL